MTDDERKRSIRMLLVAANLTIDDESFFRKTVTYFRRDAKQYGWKSLQVKLTRATELHMFSGIVIGSICTALTATACKLSDIGLADEWSGALIDGYEKLLNALTSDKACSEFTLKARRLCKRLVKQYFDRILDQTWRFTRQ